MGRGSSGKDGESTFKFGHAPEGPGDYIFQKSNGFKANEFVKAVRNARMSGKTYDEAVDRWLTKNQKKFGYKYVFKKS